MTIDKLAYNISIVIINKKILLKKYYCLKPIYFKILINKLFHYSEINNKFLQSLEVNFKTVKQFNLKFRIHLYTYLLLTSIIIKLLNSILPFSIILKNFNNYSERYSHNFFISKNAPMILSYTINLIYKRNSYKTLVKKCLTLNFPYFFS